jgi:hypothetical protein
MKISKQFCLKLILCISAGGIGFSGFLTIQKLLTSTCVLGEACQSLGPLPACAYGLIMYILIFAISIAGLKTEVEVF